MFVFFTNYHVSVNNSMVNDLLASGQTVVMPDEDFGNNHLFFFAPNNEHYDKEGVMKVTYNQFLGMPPMVLMVSASQIYTQMMELYEARGKVDTLVLLSSQLGIGEYLPYPFDYVITHELGWHRKTKARYKILYFNKTLQLVEPKTEEEVIESYNNKKINLYINHFDTHLKDHSLDNFGKERASALELRELWLAETGYRIPFYGYENLDGHLPMIEVQNKMKESMFTLVFKKHETWGQMVNESMSIGTPCIFMKPYIVDMFTEYLITKDTAVIGSTVKSIFKQLKEMTLEQYETLSMESRMASEMFCNTELNVKKLSWLFNKIEKDIKMLS